MKKILLLLLLCSCSKSEVIDLPKTRSADTTAYTPRERDTLELSDVPIGFDVSVDDWEDGGEYEM